MRTPDSFLAEFTARLQGAPPRLPLWGETVHWGAHRYRVEASDRGWVLLCPHAACPPFTHEHVRLGPLGLAWLVWNADARAFHGPALPRAGAPPLVLQRALMQRLVGAEYVERLAAQLAEERSEEVAS